MALAFTLLADDPDTTNQANYPTPAFTPAADCGLVVGVLTSLVGGPALPTLDSPTWLSGAWTQEATVVQAANASRLTVFSGKSTSSPGSDDLTAQHGVAQSGCIVQVVQVTDQDPTDFVLQPKSGTGAADISITLDNALAAATSACLAFFAHEVAEVHTPTGGETELADSSHASPARQMSVQFEINSTNSGTDWANVSGNGIGIAMEIKQAAAGGIVVPTLRLVQSGLQW